MFFIPQTHLTASRWLHCTWDSGQTSILCDNLYWLSILSESVEGKTVMISTLATWWTTRLLRNRGRKFVAHADARGRPGLKHHVRYIEGTKMTVWNAAALALSSPSTPRLWCQRRCVVHWHHEPSVLGLGRASAAAFHFCATPPSPRINCPTNRNEATKTSQTSLTDLSLAIGTPYGSLRTFVSPHEKSLICEIRIFFIIFFFFCAIS